MFSFISEFAVIGTCIFQDLTLDDQKLNAVSAEQDRSGQQRSTFCKHGPALQRSNSRVTAHLARPGAITLSRRSLSASISCLTFESPKMQVAILTPWGLISPKVRPSLWRLGLVGPTIRRVLQIFYTLLSILGVISFELFLLLPIILNCILTY